MRNRRRRVFIKKLCLTVLCGLFMVFIIFPVLYMLLNAFMKPEELSQYYADGGMSFHMLPDEFSLIGFYQIIFRRPDFLVKFWNSLLLSGAVIFGQCLVSSLAGFAFAKYEFRGKRPLFFLMIVLMLLPLQAVIVPNYVLFDKLKLLNTWWPLIVSGTFTPFGAFLMTQVFKAVPNEIIEAARLDGAGTLRVIRQIMLPVGKGGLISLIILTFIDAWNMVEQPVAFLSDTTKFPLSVFLAYFNKQNLLLSFSCGILALLPGFLLFLYYRDELTEGIEFSGI
jgi:multiple sugar transport system permease protein